MKLLIGAPLLALFLLAVYGCDGSDENGTAAEDRFPGAVCSPSRECAFNNYCLYDEGACGEDGEPGTCETLPQACTEQYQPVCGCDNVTYSNSCFAAWDGASVRAFGECPQ